MTQLTELLEQLYCANEIEIRILTITSPASNRVVVIYERDDGRYASTDLAIVEGSITKPIRVISQSVI